MATKVGDLREFEFLGYNTDEIVKLVATLDREPDLESVKLETMYKPIVGKIVEVQAEYAGVDLAHSERQGLEQMVSDYFQKLSGRTGIVFTGTRISFTAEDLTRKLYVAGCISAYVDVTMHPGDIRQSHREIEILISNNRGLRSVRYPSSPRHYTGL